MVFCNPLRCGSCIGLSKSARAVAVPVTLGRDRRNSGFKRGPYPMQRTAGAARSTFRRAATTASSSSQRSREARLGLTHSHQSCLHQVKLTPMWAEPGLCPRVNASVDARHAVHLQRSPSPQDIDTNDSLVAQDRLGARIIFGLGLASAPTGGRPCYDRRAFRIGADSLRTLTGRALVNSYSDAMRPGTCAVTAPK